MKVAIIGAGALGSLFGGLLAEHGADVWLFNPSFIKHVEQISKNGLIIEIEGKEQRIDVKATAEIEEVEEVDLAGMFVKAYDTEEATLGALPVIGERTWVLSLQNGLGNTEAITKHVGRRYSAV